MYFIIFIGIFAIIFSTLQVKFSFSFKNKIGRPTLLCSKTSFYDIQLMFWREVSSPLEISTSSLPHPLLRLSFNFGLPCKMIKSDLQSLVLVFWWSSWSLRGLGPLWGSTNLTSRGIDVTPGYRCCWTPPPLCTDPAQSFVRCEGSDSLWYWSPLAWIPNPPKIKCAFEIKRVTLGIASVCLSAVM